MAEKSNSWSDNEDKVEVVGGAKRSTSKKERVPPSEKGIKAEIAEKTEKVEIVKKSENMKKAENSEKSGSWSDDYPSPSKSKGFVKSKKSKVIIKEKSESWSEENDVVDNAPKIELSATKTPAKTKKSRSKVLKQAFSVRKKRKIR